MIDGVNISFISETYREDFSRLGIQIFSPLEEETGEVRFPKYAAYRFLHFKISESNRIEIRGSLHKYHKGENYSDFTYTELTECISDLCLKFKINPLEARVHNLEFGVNVSTLFDPFEFSRAIIAYKGDSFSKMRKGKKTGNIGFECSKTQYIIKAYDKGKQCLRNENILRYEVRAQKMAYIKSAGVYYLSDLIRQESLSRLGETLEAVFSDLIIKDKVKESELSKNQVRIYNQSINPKNWEEYTPKQRTTCKKQYNEIVRQFGLDHWQEVAGKLISDKWRMLLSPDSPKTGHVLTELLTKNSVCFDRLDNTSVHTLPEVRHCKSCGRDISGQKIGSIFCSETVFGREAKRCRNKDSNPRNNFIQRRGKFRYDNTLFEVESLLKKDKILIDY